MKPKTRKRVKQKFKVEIVYAENDKNCSFDLFAEMVLEGIQRNREQEKVSPLSDVGYLKSISANKITNQ